MTPTTIKTNWKVASGLNIGGSSVDTRLTSILQNSFEDIWNNENFTFRSKDLTLTTVANVATVDLPADYAAPKAYLIELNGNNAVTFMPEEDWYRRDRTAASNVPSYYRIKYNSTSQKYQIEFHPTPAAVYTFNFSYHASAPTLVAGDEMPIPNDFQRAVEALFYVRAYKEYNRGNIFGERIGDAKDELKKAMSVLFQVDRKAYLDEPADVYSDLNDLQIGTQEGY